ncbi:MAG TPA: hypothetical protein PLC25_04000, partial [Bacilli bacterium]|nr:hypothetical protein [Bacilli bacterium]
DGEYDKISASIQKYYGDDYFNGMCIAVNRMKNMANNSISSINETIESYFDLIDKYHLSVTTSDGAQISWNNMNVYANDTYENDYYVGTYPTLTLTPYVGYRNIGFNINGKDYYVNSIELTEDMIEDGNITIKAITQKAKDASLIISEFSADGDSDWYKIKSISDDINLNNYYLSDDSSNLTKYRLPNIALNSGETIKINGKKNYYALGNYICNFNLNNTETLYLTDGTNIIDEVPVPRMNSSETYGRYLDSNTFVYYNNLNGQRISSNY